MSAPPAAGNGALCSAGRGAVAFETLLGLSALFIFLVWSTLVLVIYALSNFVGLGEGMTGYAVGLMPDNAVATLPEPGGN